VRGIGGGEGLDIFAHDGSLQLLYSVGLRLADNRRPGP
jgi:hypothetical protein